MESLVILFVVLVLVLLAVTFAMRESEIAKLERFRAGTSTDGNSLKLPTTLGVELGSVELRGFWTGGTVTVSIGVGGTSAARRRYVAKLTVNPVEKVSASSVDLDRLCSGTYYLALKEDGTLLIRAPGFHVISGGYEGIVGVCLDPSKVPRRAVPLEILEGDEGARGEVAIDGSGIRGSAVWIFKAQVARKLTYDKDTGTYRIVEEYTSKPKARAARLEICGDAGRGYVCVRIAEATKPNEEVRGEVPYTAGRRVVILSEKWLEYGGVRELARELGMRGSSVLGYSAGALRARLVLDIPLGTDKVAEVVL
jgi:hypothetical protein